MTAQLLVHLGLYKRVVAVHMRNWDEIEESGHCNGEKDAKDAAAICQALNIPLEVVDYSREYFNDVFQDLLEGYSKGDTPSPDVLCNRVIKFQLLLDHVRAKYGQHAVLATGHYARVRQIHAETVTATIPAASTSFPSSSSSTSSFSVVPSASSAQLYIGLDPRKDQSYFLSSVPSHALMSCLCPLGWIQKSFLKQIASKWEVIIQNGPNEPIPNVTLTTAQQIQQQQQKNDDQPASPSMSSSRSSTPLQSVSRKRESMGICFIGKRSMTDFLGEYIELHSGPFVDIDTGNILGRHRGWEAWTTGQKANISGQKVKYYVCGKVQRHVAGVLPYNARVAQYYTPYNVYVCATRDHPALYTDDLILDELRWIHRSHVDDIATLPIATSYGRFLVKVRSTPDLCEAELVYESRDSFRLFFDRAQFAIAPGQTCVFYDLTGKRCLGEGRIRSPGKSYAQMGKTRNGDVEPPSEEN